MIPESGGEYPYILAAFGSLPAFLFSWMTVLVMKPASSAIITQAFAIYCVKPFFSEELLENDQHLRNKAWWWETGITILALGEIRRFFPTESLRNRVSLFSAFNCWMNCYSVKLSSKVINLFSVFKIGVIFAVSGMGLYFVAMGRKISRSLEF